MLSEQLCREYGKNTVHKKMLQVSQGLVLLSQWFSGPRTRAAGSLAELWVVLASTPGEEEEAAWGSEGETQRTWSTYSPVCSAGEKKSTSCLPLTLPRLASLPGGGSSSWFPVLVAQRSPVLPGREELFLFRRSAPVTWVMAGGALAVDLVVFVGARSRA